MGKAYRIGITGPPGVGKSTVVEKLTSVMRQRKKSVGIVCVDPSSPFSGGALLGDRIRMQQHCLDNEVFIRSMATRGYHGGLSKALSIAVKLMDASGKDFVLIETVGVGQTEVDIMENADTVIVVLVPEGGDIVQAMKAGIMEIGDIFIVNKADRPGASETASAVKSMLMLNRRPVTWQRPVAMMQAVNDIGTIELYELIEKHRQTISNSGELECKRRGQRRHEFMLSLERELTQELHSLFRMDSDLSAYVGEVENGKLDPDAAAKELLSEGALKSIFKQSSKRR
jgi:LAO/AO transport system kinase